jgi:hypothetical protein
VVPRGEREKEALGVGEGVAAARGTEGVPGRVLEEEGVAVVAREGMGESVEEGDRVGEGVVPLEGVKEVDTLSVRLAPGDSEGWEEGEGEGVSPSAGPLGEGEGVDTSRPGEEESMGEGVGWDGVEEGEWVTLGEGEGVEPPWEPVWDGEGLPEWEAVARGDWEAEGEGVPWSTVLEGVPEGVGEENQECVFAPPEPSQLKV